MLFKGSQACTVFEGGVWTGAIDSIHLMSLCVVAGSKLSALDPAMGFAARAGTGMAGQRGLVQSAPDESALAFAPSRRLAGHSLGQLQVGSVCVGRGLGVRHMSTDNTVAQHCGGACQSQQNSACQKTEALPRKLSFVAWSFLHPCRSQFALNCVADTRVLIPCV